MVDDEGNIYNACIGTGPTFANTAAPPFRWAGEIEDRIAASV